MPDYFNQGFFVREPAWHGLGTVLDEYPGREEAMKLAGHDFRVIERPIVVVGREFQPGDVLPDLTVVNGGTYGGRKAEDFKALIRQDTGDIMQIAGKGYEIVQNDTAWDIVDALANVENVKYETGLTLKDGRICSVLAYLDEPVTIPGDDSQTLPYLNVSWSHDGSSAIRARSTSIRVVCWNTLSAAEAEASRRGTEFTFRHTKTVHARIDDAKMAIRGVRDSFAVYTELARELAKIPVTIEQRELFITTLIPMPDEALISDRVKQNVEDARTMARHLFGTASIPEAHKLTAYGLQLAGVEYLDHVRPARSPETKYGRSLLRDEPAKSKLHSLIKEVVKA